MWPSRNVTYNITEYGLYRWKRKFVDIEISRAAQVWNGYADIFLSPIKNPTDPVDIEISFLPKEHGDGHPFMSAIPAHAFYPNQGGQIHFYEAANFTFNTTRGVNLYAVAAHEFGHTLGLAHSDEKKALMHFLHKGYTGNVIKLHQDDIEGLQKMYGTWGIWSVWTRCTRSCQGGIHTRTRRCQLADGKCEGRKVEHKRCNTQPCRQIPRQSSWNQWSQWGSCSRTCGNGYQTRYRSCQPLNGGCSGRTVENQSCQSSICATSAFWRQWSEWTKCSKTCDKGFRSRHRDCQPANGKCTGSSIQEKTCQTRPCAIWSRWTTWEECSRSCGTGIRSRKRFCFPSNGQCSGGSIQQQNCNIRQCANWGRWSQWQKCSKTCNKGFQSRQRYCHPSNGNCLGTSIQEQSCNHKKCPFYPRDLIHGKFCKFTKPDAVINLPDNRTYIFSGSLLWIINKLSSRVMYTQFVWNLPPNIDAALDFTGSRICYFFKGDKYWKLDTSGIYPESSYPRRVGVDGFYGIPPGVESAFMLKNRVYFTKGGVYYRLGNSYHGNPHEVEFYKAAPNFPKYLYKWQGLPSGGVDAAVHLPDECTYFFKGNQYYRYNHRLFKVEENYPKSTLKDWLRCDL